jgi:integrase
MLTKRKRGKIYYADLLKGRVYEVRGSLGTRSEDAASALISRIDLAIAQGPSSILPAATYLRFADYAGVQAKQLTTWSELRTKFEGDLEERLTVNNISKTTVFGYQRTLGVFERFLTSRDKPVPLVREIDKDIAREFKYHRLRAIQKRRGPNAGTGYRTEVDILHRIFEFGIENNMISENPFQHEPKIIDPLAGAQPFSGPELVQLRQHAGEDLLLFLVFRYTGLRISDAVTLSWQELDLARGVIRKRTQKSRYRKVAVIPMSNELRLALERERENRSAQPSDTVLLIPIAGHKVAALRYRIQKLGRRSGVEGANSHRFRDTFAVDSLLKGVPESSVASMLADTVRSVIDHYLPFVQALQEHAKNLLNTGKGLEEY